MQSKDNSNIMINLIDSEGKPDGSPKELMYAWNSGFRQETLETCREGDMAY